MRCRCEPDWTEDKFSRMLVAGMLYSALCTEYLVFFKTEWVEDCGFIFGEKDVELPRNLDGKRAKINCFTECLKLLNDGWENEIAERNKEMMVSYLNSLKQEA